MLASIKLRGQEHLSHLEGKWMTPVPFILALKEAGLNIFPTVYSHFYVVINNKVTEALYVQWSGDLGAAAAKPLGAGERPGLPST